MNIFTMGGWMMWPLALVSIAVTTIIIERLLFFSAFHFPPRKFPRLLEDAATGNAEPLLACLHSSRLLKQFVQIIETHSPGREAALKVEGELILAKLERFLPVLGLLARLAPLLGLLGTVLGMITTFSEIADAQGGMNMNQLAGGIWQALLTTAFGLGIAIPALFFLHIFQNRVNAAARAISDAGNILLGLKEA